VASLETGSNGQVAINNGVKKKTTGQFISLKETFSDHFHFSVIFCYRSVRSPDVSLLDVL
jgi:hypothetical protein